MSKQEEPVLHFFRYYPENFMSKPPLCSSLQKFETSLILVSHGCYPAAIVTCCSAIESAIKAHYEMAPEEKVGLSRLISKVKMGHPKFAKSRIEIDHLRDARNRIEHFGFSPHDDKETSRYLIRAGIPYLALCYQEFFGFDLHKALLPEISEQLKIASAVCAKATGHANIRPAFFLRGLRHHIFCVSKKVPGRNGSKKPHRLLRKLPGRNNGKSRKDLKPSSTPNGYLIAQFVMVSIVLFANWMMSNWVTQKSH